MNYREQLQTKEWKELRDSVLKEYDNRCCGCGSKDNLNVHHISYKSGCKAWEYLPEDLTVLCKECHTAYHKNAKRIKELLCDGNLYMISDCEQAIEILEKILKIQPHLRSGIHTSMDKIIENQITF